MENFEPPKIEKETKKKLKLYWEEFNKLKTEFFTKINELQNKMNKEMNLGMDLEFFYVDGECVGIGASKFSDREKFPLLQDEDFDK